MVSNVSLLGSAKELKACNVKHEEAMMFLAENGLDVIAEDDRLVSIGLRKHDETLVAVAQFCAPRTDGMKKRYTTELRRIVFKADLQIEGGRAALIDFYRSTRYPSDIFMYEDTCSTAYAYESLGFTLLCKSKLNDCFEVAEHTLATTVRSAKELGDLHYAWVDVDRTYYTYKITSPKSPKYYIGVSHLKKANATAEECRSHSYMGSGGAHPQNKFSVWKKKYQDSLQKEVLATHALAAEAFAAEERLIGKLHSDDVNCLNSTTGGKTGGLARAFYRVSTKSCKIHGLVSHAGESCMKCSAATGWMNKQCETHGETLFHGDQCAKCTTSDSVKTGHCDVHGEGKFQGNQCCRCRVSGRESLKACAVHGETNHVGEKCRRCLATSRNILAICSAHGETIHQGATCLKCAQVNRYVVQLCSIHGETKFLGAACVKCSSKATVTEKECPIHGLVLHRGSTCATCASQDTVQKRTCVVHGAAKFRGNSCYKCTNMRSAHRRHLTLNVDCFLCVGEKIED